MGHLQTFSGPKQTSVLSPKHQGHARHVCFVHKQTSSDWSSNRKAANWCGFCYFDHNMTHRATNPVQPPLQPCVHVRGRRTLRLPSYEALHRRRLSRLPRQVRAGSGPPTGPRQCSSRGERFASSSRVNLSMLSSAKGPVRINVCAMV